MQAKPRRMFSSPSKRGLVLAAALCGLLYPIALTTALGQSVAARAASNDEGRSISDSDDGGSSRSIYSQKHLSPHRMMHFGKRPLITGPPVLFDLYRQPPPSAMHRYGRTMSSRQPLPYTLYFDMPRDQVLEFVQPDSPKRQLIEAVPDLLEYAKRSYHAQQRINQQAAQVPTGQTNPLDRAAAFPSPRTENSDEAESPFELSASLGGLAAKKQSLMASENAGQQQAGQPEQQDASGASNGQQDGDGISLASRSAAAHNNELPFQGIFRQPDISSYLYGPHVANPQSGQALLTMGNFIKKAEPQRNAMKFMHFGR